MIHEVFAPGMHNRAYFHRYTDDNVDLCDVLSSFSYGAKVKLDELSRIMGLPGKPDGIDGSQVEAYFNAGRDPGDRGLLQVRRDQHVPAMATARAVSRAAGSEPV